MDVTTNFHLTYITFLIFIDKIDCLKVFYFFFVTYNMIEVYVALALFGLGYFFNQNKEVLTSNARKIDANDIPSQKSLYESKHIDTVKQDEIKRAEAFNKASQQIQKDNKPPEVISKNYADERSKKSSVKSNLAGVEFDENDFVHSNMVPFFKGKMGPNTDQKKNELQKSKIENFTGISQHFQPKKETETMFEMKKDMSHVNGAPHQIDFIESRIAKPVSHNNVLPFKQEKVGPGLNQGYTTEPVGGYQQFEVQDFAKPKTVDELRTKTNPKKTYEGRVIPGQKGSVPGKVGKMAKNKPDTVYKNTPDRYFKTTGAHLKPIIHPKYDAKCTNRQATSQAYQGIAHDSSKQKMVQGYIHPSQRQQLDAFNKGPINQTHKGKKEDDYGKKSIQVYANERDTTSTRTYEGNVSSMVKAAIAPIQDILRMTKKQYLDENPRTFGQTQAPEKLPVRDTNDVARTTIKETTLSEAEKLNFRGHLKGIAYDPNDVAKTTIKETTLSDAEKMNLKGPTKLYVYDPNDIAKTTVKETTLSESPFMNFKGEVKCYVHDPNDVARTTIKETTLNEAQVMNLRGHQKCYIYNPNDVARTTIKETTLAELQTNLKGNKINGIVYIPDDKSRMTLRETLDNIDNSLNFSSIKKSGILHDPNDIAKTTIKETTVDNDHFGNVDLNRVNVGEFRDGNYYLPETHKQFLSDNDYIGQAAINHEDGYKIAPTDMKETVRQFNSDHEYLGPGDNENKKPMSYEDIYNAYISDSKEVILENREPTKESVKIAAGVDKSIDLACRKNEVEDLSKHFYNNAEKTKVYEPVKAETFTKCLNKTAVNERLDPDNIHEVLKNNPYFQSVVSE